MTLPQPQIRINLFKNFPRAAAPTAPESLVAALSPAGQAHQLPPAQPGPRPPPGSSGCGASAGGRCDPPEGGSTLHPVPPGPRLRESASELGQKAHFSREKESFIK